MPIKKLKQLKQKHAPKGSFASHALTLMTGTAIAQIIPIAVSPILTRIYSPSDFGVFAVYMAIVTIAAGVSTGCYELAIMLPEKEEDAMSIVVLSVSITLIVSFVSLICVMAFGHYAEQSFKITYFNQWAYFIPLGIFLTGIFQTLNYWLIRKKMFRRLSFRKIIQSSIMTIFQLAAGFLAFGPLGLIIGFVLGQLFGYGFLAWQVWKEDSTLLKGAKAVNIIRLAKRYRDFPLYSTPSNISNIAANQAPTIILNSFFDATTVGLFSLPRRVVYAPVTLIARSIQDVFKEKASRDYRKMGNCADVYKKTFKGLLALSFIPFLVLFLFSPWLIPFIFGSSWKLAGEYTQILSVVAFFGFIASPLSFVLYLAEKQNYNFIWQLILLVTTAASLIVGSNMHNAKVAITLFALSYSVMYIIYIGISFSLSKGNKR